MTTENTLKLGIARACYRLTQPASMWRLATRNGELILQAGSIWVDGEGTGIEWADLPIVDLVDLDEQEADR